MKGTTCKNQNIVVAFSTYDIRTICIVDECGMSILSTYPDLRHDRTPPSPFTKETIYVLTADYLIHVRAINSCMRNLSATEKLKKKCRFQYRAVSGSFQRNGLCNTI